jgi:hypothetical protein
VTTKLTDDDLILDGSSPTLTIDINTRCVVSSTGSFNAPLAIGDMDEAGYQWVETGIDLPATSMLRYLTVEIVSGSTATSEVWIADWGIYSRSTLSYLPLNEPAGFIWFGSSPGMVSPTGNGYRGPDLRAVPGYQGNPKAFIFNGFADYNSEYVWTGIQTYSKQVYLKVSGSGDISGGSPASVKCHAVYETWDFD